MSELEATHTDPAVEIAQLRQRLTALEQRLAQCEQRLPQDKISLLIFSNDLDKLISAFILATGAASLGQEVVMFFTFWGIAALRDRKLLKGKDLPQRLMTLMTPAGLGELVPSKLAFWGAGAAMMREMMRRQSIMSLEDMFAAARDLGVRFFVCETSMDIMGISREELNPVIEAAGVAGFLGEALESKATLYI